MSTTAFATMYPPWFVSWNHFYGVILHDEAQDDDEYTWAMEPVLHEGITRYYIIQNSPYRYQVRYVQQQALAELRAKRFNFEEANVIYQAVQRYANEFKDSVFYDRLKPLVNKLEGIARRVPYQP